VVDKLVKMQIVDAVAVFNWLFSEKVTPHFTRQYIWDILESTVLKTNRSHDQAIKELADTNERLKKVKRAVAVSQSRRNLVVLSFRKVVFCTGYTCIHQHF
jgi:hypothetical protein